MGYIPTSLPTREIDHGGDKVGAYFRKTKDFVSFVKIGGAEIVK